MGFSEDKDYIEMWRAALEAAAMSVANDLAEKMKPKVETKIDKDLVKYSPSLSELIKESIARGTLKDVKRTIRTPESLIDSLMESIALAMNNEPFIVNFGGSESHRYSGKESVSVCESHHYEHSDGLNESHSFAENDQETKTSNPVPTNEPDPHPFGLTFGQAISALRLGLKVARNGWNGKGLWLELQVPDANSKMTLPYIYMNYPSKPASDTAPANHMNARVPWLASHTDMLTDDWHIVF